MLLRRRSIPFPTVWGWLVLAVFIFAPGIFWIHRGEATLATSDEVRGGVLVVEGWIGTAALRDAHAEFTRGGYSHVVATGHLSGHAWHDRRWSYAEEAEEFLLRRGLSREQLILAKPRANESHRTFECAIAVRQQLELHAIRPESIVVYTMGAHGRRSRLTYAKVFSGYSKVGVISWLPPTYSESPWWTSSERALDLIKETGAYLFELFLNSGRTSNKA